VKAVAAAAANLARAALGVAAVGRRFVAVLNAVVAGRGLAAQGIALATVARAAYRTVAVLRVVAGLGCGARSSAASAAVGVRLVLIAGAVAAAGGLAEAFATADDAFAVTISVTVLLNRTTRAPAPAVSVCLAAVRLAIEACGARAPPRSGAEQLVRTIAVVEATLACQTALGAVTTTVDIRFTFVGEPVVARLGNASARDATVILCAIGVLGAGVGPGIQSEVASGDFQG
jgi:hypothetical protein